MNRAYSLLDVKSVDEERRIIEGVATTPTTDRVGDIVEPLGAQFKLPLPFLWQHGRDPFVGPTPVGHLTNATPTADGIPVRIQMEKSDTPGRLKDILDFAWEAVKRRLVRGLSIGFAPLEVADIKGSWGQRVIKWDWLELSGVTIPANADATITAVKSAAALLERTSAPSSTSAPGPDRSTTKTPTGATVRSPSTTRREGVAMKTTTERIKAIANERALLVARQTEIMSVDDGQTLTKDKQDEFDNLDERIEALDGEAKRLEIVEKRNREAARPVLGSTPEEGLASRAPASTVPVVTVRANRDPGIGFARAVICKLIGFMNHLNPVEVAKARYPDDLAVHLYLKAAIGASTTTDPVNAAPIAYPTDLPGEFLEFLRPQTIIGRMPGLRNVPFNVRWSGMTSGGTAGWVGQAKPKPLTKFDYDQGGLGITKLAAISVIADELAMVSRPDAETTVRAALTGAVVQKQDHDFIDPAITEITNVRPASITNGVTPTASSGNDANAVRADLAALLGKFVVANVDPTKAVLIMPNTLCLMLSLMVNALGQQEFSGMTIQGGTLSGLPVLGTQQASLGAPHGNIVVLANADQIFLADDGSVAIDVNRYASLEMSDAPTQDGETGTGAELVSLWQNNLIGIRAERHINWKKARPTAVEYLDDVQWGAPVGP
jgi:HK97 family phage major capsid protein